LLILVFSSARADEHENKDPSACNGHAELCDRTYNNVTYLVTHNAYATDSNIAANQDRSILEQLDDGVRGLKLTAIVKDDSLHLCHTHCSILDAGPVVDTLDTIAGWLKSHPSEVVTLMWNNGETAAIAKAYQNSAIFPMVYSLPQDTQAWPTLRDMISRNTRVVSFVDNWSDVPYLIDEFAHVFETPYDTTNPDQFLCTIDRPENPEHPNEMMYLVNHFLYGVIQLGKDHQIEVPQKDKAASTNHERLEAHLKDCIQSFQRKPTFVEVDFYAWGD
ncbi:PLC-like phosphodiesterase, partial [Syncephalastrum racemosum]